MAKNRYKRVEKVFSISLGAGCSPFKPENTVSAIPWYACDTGTSPASRGGQKNRLTTCLTTSGTKLNNQKSGISAVGSALALGARCREFESPISDHSPWNCSISGAVFLLKYALLWTIKILAHFWILVRRSSFSQRIQHNLAHPREFSGHAW